MRRIVLATVLFLQPVAAQKALLADDPERQVGVFAVRDLVGDDAADTDAGEGARLPRVDPARAKDIASLLVGRAQWPDDHIEAVGPGHVVALGGPAWIGSVESMLVHMRAAGQRQYQVDTKFCRISDALAAQLDSDHLRGIRNGGSETDRSSWVLDGDAAMTLLRAIRADKESETVQAPQIVAHELDRKRIRVGKSVVGPGRGLARDNRSEVPPPGGIWCGDDATIVVATTSKEKVTVSVDVAHHGLDVAQIESELGGLQQQQGGRVNAAIPRACRALASEELVNGSTLVVAARGADGVMVTMVAVHEIWSAGVPARRR